MPQNVQIKIPSEQNWNELEQKLELEVVALNLPNLNEDRFWKVSMQPFPEIYWNVVDVDRTGPATY